MHGIERGALYPGPARRRRSAIAAGSIGKSPPVPRNRERIAGAHLLGRRQRGDGAMQREWAAARFGFGAVAGEWPEPGDFARRPAPAADGFPRVSTAAVLGEIDALGRARRARNQGQAGAAEEFDRLRAGIIQGARAAARGSIAIAVAAGAHGPAADFHERLVWFWADHFTAAARRLRDQMLPAAFVDDAIRPHVTGPFRTLLRAAILHPAMLIYLDKQVSVGPGSRIGQRHGAGLNENLARELLELHTLGVGSGYTQADVTELAELLTGLAVDRAEGTLFDPRRAEPGAETVLGQQFGGDPARIEHIHAVLDALAARPETARHIARKLAVHFVADTPDPGLVDRLAATFADSGGDLGTVAAALAADPVARDTPPAKVRRPFEVLVAGLRALGLSGAEVMELRQQVANRHLLAPMAAMGQPWLAPAGPDGWPEEAEAWITPQRLAARIDWAMTAPAVLVPELPDPREMAVAALGGLAAGTLAFAVGGAEVRSEGIGLVLAAPAFNRR
jgi:uncharacterized protein (DUF1800 family)